MKRLQYIKPGIDVTPYSEQLMAIGGSAGTGDNFSKELDFGDDYGDFLSSYNRGKEIKPFSED